LKSARGFFLGLAGLGILTFAAEVRAASDLELPPGPDRDLVYGQCRTCHDLQSLADSAGIPRASWAAVLDNMRQYGLRLAPDQRDKILEYLAVYLGPNPPPAAEAAPPSAASPADGQTVYLQNCAACHQPNGQGVAGQFPPLAGNPDLFLDRLFPVYVVLNGLSGEVTVAGEQFRSTMPPFDHLADASIAAVVNHVRSAWGNAALRPADMADVDAQAVAKAREKPMTAAEVLAYRADRK
jgi:mono/diheme cytochrome c family protein